MAPGAYFLIVAGYAALNAESYASDMPRLLRYLLGPLAVGGVLVAAPLLLGPENRLMAGLISASVLASLFAVEALLTVRSLAGAQSLFGYIANPVQAARYHGAMPPGYTLKALNNALGVTEPRQVMLGGIPDVEVLLCSRDGAPISYRADPYGLRNPAHVHAESTSILVLGDSFAEGICLPTGEDLVSRIRTREAATLNTGTRGAGPLFALAVLRRWGPELRPRNTLMLFFEGNDWENLAGEMTLPYLRPFLDLDLPPGPTRAEAATLAAARDVIGHWWDEYGRMSRDPRRNWARNFLALHQTSVLLGLHYPKGFPDQPDYDRVLRAARDVVDGWNGRLTVVYIPRVDRFVGLLPNGVAFDGLRYRVRQATEDAGVGFLDLTELMFEAPVPRSLYAPDSHLSEAGTRLAGDAIYRHLQLHD